MYSISHTAYGMQLVASQLRHWKLRLVRGSTLNKLEASWRQRTEQFAGEYVTPDSLAGIPYMMILSAFG